MSSRYANPINNRFLRDKEGNLLPGGTLELFAAGTSDTLEVYSDPALTTSLGSVLPADSFGLLPDFHLLAGTKYKLVAKNAAGAVQWTTDEVFSLDSSVDTRLDTIEQTLQEIGVARNAFVNGGMRVDLGTDRTLDATFGEGKVSNLLGRATNVTAGTLTQSADNAYASGKYAHFSGVSTSSAGVVEAQLRIPAEEATRFVDGSGTFSCMVQHDVGSDVTYTVEIKKPTLADNDFATLTTVATSPGIVATDGNDTRLTFSVGDLGDVSRGIAVEVSAAVSVVTGKNFRITEAQFESGETRSAFTESGYEEALAALGWRMRSQHTGTQPASTITGLGHLASLNSVAASNIINGAVTGAAIANSTITSGKFPAPVAGTSVKHWEASSNSSTQRESIFTAQLSGSVTLRQQTGAFLAVFSGNGTNVHSTNSLTSTMNITKGTTYLVEDGTGTPVYCEVLTSNDTGIAAVV